MLLTPPMSFAAASEWALSTARREVDGAIAVLDGAIHALRSLVADSTWSSRGVTALNQALVDLESEALGRRTMLRQQLWELERRL